MAAARGLEVRVTNAHKELSLDEERVVRLVYLVTDEKPHRAGIISVILGDHALVTDLNRRYLDHEDHTDVLAFPLSGDREPLEGEIYVDLDTAMERCREFDQPFDAEALRYVAHGMLHLVGHSDKTESGKELMTKLEDAYLSRLDELDADLS